MSRPRKFQSVEEMETAIDEYFTKCDTNTRQVYSKQAQEIVDMEAPIPYTIEGLCNVLDIDRKTLLNYQNKDEFFHIVKKAKADVLQNQIEHGLIGSGNSTMTIFLMKNNHDYRDKHEVSQDTKTSGTLSIEIVEDKKE